MYYSWFAADVIATMLVYTINKRFQFDFQHEIITLHYQEHMIYSRIYWMTSLDLAKCNSWEFVLFIAS